MKLISSSPPPVFPYHTTVKSRFDINNKKRRSSYLIRSGIISAANITTFLVRRNAAPTGNLISRAMHSEKQKERKVENREDNDEPDDDDDDGGGVGGCRRREGL